MRGVRRLVVVGVFVALAAGCGDNLRPGEGQPPTPTGPSGQSPAVTAWLRFAPDLQSAEHGGFQEEFPLYQQRDVLAVIGVPDGDGARKLRLDVTGPGGGLLESRWVGFTTKGAAPETLEVGGGVVGDVPVERVRVVDGHARLLVPIAIAGTTLTRYHLKGRHTVSLYVDGAATPAAVGAFELRGAP